MPDLHSSDPQSAAAVSPAEKDMTHYSEASAGREPRRRWSGVLLGMGAGVLLTLVGTQLLGGRENTPSDQTEAPPAVATQTVTVAVVTPDTVADTLAINGSVQATDLLTIAPQASGLQIRQILVREGDAVSAGQAIATLDDATLQADLRQAQAQLSVSQAQVTQRQAALAQAQATLAEAQQNLARLQSLADQGAISQQELARQRTQTVTAQEAISLSRAEVESAEAGVRSQQAAIDRLQTQLSQTTVRAPLAGVVAERQATVGDVSAPGTPIVTLIQNNQLELAAEVPQTQLDQVAIGAPVTVTSNADSRIQLRGTVQSIDPVVDAATRVATVNVSLPASDLLRPGIFLRGEVTTSSRQGLTIPAVALQPQPDSTTQVFVLSEGNVVEAREVELGNRIAASGDEAAQVEILQGLASGEQVVTSGVGFLQDGDVVTVVPQDS
ncbi:efflux RND transporter periplasmic adaptor subunit [Leptolyngbya sp. CCNP1308]|uniref:efflux RND transporter periplasmic adaptor subunit n=1 Tax=Leptolyngbya sp. CCNP1308 TaxID=3110255 RepID=UPI002B21D6FA|nr:efflux RND transporter periplasmic adaptor subunit [Leptolyngbya sp. CCNP1308]MEA5447153.1 efflux RND transporter periplasmic adaptor subunit [Leptolyngbya sp. CCNP1308]